MDKNTGKRHVGGKALAIMALAALLFLPSCQHQAQARLIPQEPAKHDTLSPVLDIGKAPQGRKNLDLDYDVYAGGFHALTASLAMGLGKADYEIELEAKTQGFIGSLFPWKAHYETNGKTDGKRYRPALHQSESTWKKSVTSVEMTYDKRGVFTSKKELENNKPKAQPRDAAVKSLTIASDAVDILTGTMQILQNVNLTDGCNSKAQVFDGKRRFNIIFKDMGIDTLRKNRYSRFQGEARKCNIIVEPVAGFKDKDKKRGWMAVQEHTLERDRLPTIWLAPLYQKGPIVPVRMEIASEYGSVVAHLSGTDAK